MPSQSSVKGCACEWEGREGKGGEGLTAVGNDAEGGIGVLHVGHAAGLHAEDLGEVEEGAREDEGALGEEGPQGVKGDGAAFFHGLFVAEVAVEGFIARGLGDDVHEGLEVDARLFVLVGVGLLWLGERVCFVPGPDQVLEG